MFFFFEKMNFISICTREDRVLDSVRTLGRVESGAGAQAPHRSALKTITLSTYYTYCILFNMTYIFINFIFIR